MSRILLSALIVLIPGLLAYWVGLRLMTGGADPVFADRLWRYRKQVVNAGLLAAMAVMLIAELHALWLLPIMLLATLRGIYPLRRALFGERWSFAAYASFTLRLKIGLGAFWLALVAVPWLGVLGKGHALWIAALAAAILITAKACSRPLLSRLLALEPWRPEADEIAVALRRIHRAATVSPPMTFRVPVTGGNWVNALAMPAIREPWIIFSETLLKTFDAREVAAVYAHELAHLEEMDPPWAKRRELLEWGLVVIAIAVTAYGAWFPGILPVHLIWALALLLSLARVQGASRGREEHADRRAVELIGDPGALESAILKLHDSARMPRRWSWGEAKRLTHPSLARRLQSIRSAGVEIAGDQEQPQVEAETSDRLLVPGDTAGSFLLLDHDHVRRLTGVPEGTSREPRSVLDAAAEVSSDRYDGLAELRLEPWRRTYRVAGRPLGGRKWTFVPWSAAWPRKLALAGAEAMQRHLDRVDHLLVMPPDGSGSLLPSASVRLLAGVAVLLALIPDFYASVAMVALAAALVPVSAVLAAAGSMGVAASVHALLLAKGSWLPLELDAFQGWPLLVASIPLLLAARAERAGDHGGITARRTGIMLLLAALPLWMILMAAAASTGDPPDTFAIDSIARDAPSLFLLPIGAVTVFSLGGTCKRS